MQPFGTGVVAPTGNRRYENRFTLDFSTSRLCSDREGGFRRVFHKFFFGGVCRRLWPYIGVYRCLKGAQRRLMEARDFFDFSLLFRVPPPDVAGKRSGQNHGDWPLRFFLYDSVLP